MSQSFVKKPYQGPLSALSGLGVLTAEQQRILDAIPKRCEPCRSVGAVHCSDPANCGGPWDTHDRAQWLLYEHEDGRHAVAPSAEAATFAHADPAWHRVGPVEVPATSLSDADIDRIQEECDAFCCESCDVRIHEFARAVAAHVSGVTVRDHQSFCSQTPTKEGEGKC